MTPGQKHILDKKDEAGLRMSISVLTATSHDNKDELIAYCEERLERLNRVNAMVERSDPSDAPILND